MPTFIARPRPEQMLELLKKARNRLACGEDIFLCHALAGAASKRPDLMYTSRYLQDYITRQIAPFTTFSGWLTRYFSETNDPLPRDTDALTWRLAWADWMIAGLEEELAGIKASQAIESAGEQS